MIHARAETATRLKELRKVGCRFSLRQRRELQRLIEIRIRAERRLGEMLIEQKQGEGLATGGQPYQSTSTRREPVDKTPTLADIGIRNRKNVPSLAGNS